ncbi:MAG: T9SS type A sorting domain-containing protein [Bacteroidales bacterium]|jgi:hypothetical protein|nr:T9SS type A sorting domain-containing protein [Bacteroidales bacterium]HHT52241.1 T9SS type A sorting domain-containing protein [Bacteroidales bacterium]
MKKKCLIILFFLLPFLLPNGGSEVIAQRTGIVWVVPQRTDALPVDGIRSGNYGLNLIFEDYGVVEYTFLDSLYFTDQLDLNMEPIMKPVYQIRLREEDAHKEDYFVKLLNCCYRGFFEDFDIPYYNICSDGETVTTDNGLIILDIIDGYFDPTLYPSSSKRSNNAEINQILERYDIKYYRYRFSIFHGDTVMRSINIASYYEDALPLFYDLLDLDHLYDYISIARSTFLGDMDYPCGSYSGISTETESILTLFPNPAQDEIFISGIVPESVVIYDALGKRITTEFDAKTNKVDLKYLPHGLYIVKIITIDGKLFTDKIIKQ